MAKTPGKKPVQKIKKAIAKKPVKKAAKKSIVKKASPKKEITEKERTIRAANLIANSEKKVIQNQLQNVLKKMQLKRKLQACSKVLLKE